jgi:hypothetical protein
VVDGLNLKSTVEKQTWSEGAAHIFAL